MSCTDLTSVQRDGLVTISEGLSSEPYQQPRRDTGTDGIQKIRSMEVRSRKGREISPERIKAHRLQQQRVSPVRKVQVVYYLSRNGQLEHPHFMELTHLANEPIRMKDVMDRLVMLRGKGMPSLYSWSCKRSYKSGYVWFDLTENDIIYPAEGAEYVLKGSELVEKGCSDNLADMFQQLNLSNRHSGRREGCLNFKGKHCSTSSPRTEADPYVEFEQDQEEECEDGEKTSYTSSTSRCSVGVSTEEMEDPVLETVPPEIHKNLSKPNGFPLVHAPSPRPSVSTVLISNSTRVPDKTNQADARNKGESKYSTYKLSPKTMEACNNKVAVDTVKPSSVLARNSVLLQLIACGALGPGNTKTKRTGTPASLKTTVMKSESLHRGVVCHRAAKVVADADSDMIKINCMSENPRFGNLQSEEKEYFSGSIIESMSTEDRDAMQPVLKKSNSYNEDRGTPGTRSKSEIGEATVGGKKEKPAPKGKCLPRMKSSATPKQN